MNLFGKAKQAQVEKPKQQASAVEIATNLQQNIELLEKKKENIEGKIRAKTNLAKEKGLRGDKNGALNELNFIREYKKQQKTINTQQLLLEKQKIELDNAHTRSIVFDGLDMANKEISRISKNMDEEKQSEILDTMEEIRANNEEINDRMEAMVGGDLAEDEELEQQLADLMMENNKQVQSNLQPASVLNFPSLPNSQVNQAPARPSRVNDEEEALRALAAEMS